jgi:hypothetical protein
MHGPDLSAAKPAANQQARIPKAYERRVGARRAVDSTQEVAQAPHRPTAFEAPEPLTGERFPHRVRLARGSELTACWEEGRRWRTPHLELAWRPNQAGHPRVGLIVPARELAA